MSRVDNTLSWKEKLDRLEEDILLLDIDSFKCINDSFGHQVGDEVLYKIVKYIKDKSRKIDFVGRRGGEEFLIICPNTPLENAVLLAEQLRKGLMKVKISTGTVVTASFGVGHISDEESTNALIKRIDDALYHAKEKGRNRLVKSVLFNKYSYLSCYASQRHVSSHYGIDDKLN